MNQKIVVYWGVGGGGEWEMTFTSRHKKKIKGKENKKEKKAFELIKEVTR